MAKAQKDNRAHRRKHYDLAKRSGLCIDGCRVRATHGLRCYLCAVANARNTRRLRNRKRMPAAMKARWKP